MIEHFPDCDIFCQVVDNYGDIGFSYRFARMYKKRHPEATVRLFVDKPDTLKKIRGTEVEILILPSTSVPDKIAPLIIETFGSNIPDIYKKYIIRDTRLWINIEHLSAENWTVELHGKESPQGIPGLKKLFYMPGLQPGTGGVLTDFQAPSKDENIISLFTYTQDFSQFFQACTELPSMQFLIFDQYTQKSLACDSPAYPQHTFVMSPFVSQDKYDGILASSRLNFVRGEESLIRAILAGKPFLWQAYLQDNDYQLVKVDAWLEMFQKFFSSPDIFNIYRVITRAWNGDSTALAVDNWRVFLQNLPAIGLAAQAFGRYLRQSCDMGLLFDQFITQNW
jgi:hypothetical protein